MSKNINKTRILQIGRELESQLLVFFQEIGFVTCGGKHWQDRSKTPLELAKDSIKVNLTHASKPEWSCSTVRLDFDIISEQPSHVFAVFNLCRGEEVGSNYSIVNLMLSVFNGSKLINTSVDFQNEPCLRFVFRDDLNGLYFHINLFPRFGHREFPNPRLLEVWTKGEGSISKTKNL
jgi:hypothetical protein